MMGTVGMGIAGRGARTEGLERFEMKIAGQEIESQMQSQNQNQNKMPDKKFKAGRITATVWKRTNAKGEPYYNIQLGKSYKDKENNWKTTSSLRENDVPKAVLLLQKAYDYVIFQ